MVEEGSPNFGGQHFYTEQSSIYPGTESPPPVYAISSPTYLAPPQYLNTLPAGHLVQNPPQLVLGRDDGGMRKDQLPPSYHQLFPSSTGPATLPPIEIVPTHHHSQLVPNNYSQLVPNHLGQLVPAYPVPPPLIQQHVPYGLPQPPRGVFVPPPRNSTFRERMSYIRRYNNIVHPLSEEDILKYRRMQNYRRWVLSYFVSALVILIIVRSLF